MSIKSTLRARANTKAICVVRDNKDWETVTRKDELHLDALLQIPEIRAYVEVRYPGHDKILWRDEAFRLLQSAVEYICVTIPYRVNQLRKHYEETGVLDSLPHAQMCIADVILDAHLVNGETTPVAQSYIQDAVLKKHEILLSYSNWKYHMLQLDKKGLFRITIGTRGQRRSS